MKPMILAPVGDNVMLTAAINAGADAVYLGVKGINMRAGAKNFELNELAGIVNKCHENNVKVYLTLNVIVYDDEIDKIKNILSVSKDAGIDAIICWDMSVINLCKEFGLDFHLSTQASISNFESVKHYSLLGAKAVVLARELSLKQIKNIIDKIKEEKLNVKIECFIHGAMCVAISGRCFMSQFAFGKSANRGECLQPCRREYDIKDKEGICELKLGNNYVMSPKDLCTVSILDQLVSAGIDILKIEGRNRKPEYVDTTVSVYKKLLDSVISKEDAVKELERVYHRNFHEGFYLGTPTSDDFTNMYGSASKTKKKYIGYVKKYFNKINVCEILVESGEIKIGDLMMIQGPTTGTFNMEVKEMQIEHEKVSSAKKQERVAIKVLEQCRPKDKVFVLVYEE